MQYTESVVDCPKGMAQEDPTSVDWQTAFEGVNDPRRKQGQRYSITSILLLALAAMLSNHLSELAIAQWGAAQSEEVKKALGFYTGVTPHQSTMQRLFRRLNTDEVEAAFRRLLLHLFEKGKEERGGQALSLDGKAQRGRLKCEEEGGAYPVHAVSIVDHQTGVVLISTGTGNCFSPKVPLAKLHLFQLQLVRRQNICWLTTNILLTLSCLFVDFSCATN